ncbi:hypothetical protein HHI36_013229 [Cryptolaemus montrouzieri]|uniref:Uncharacterized protein n=1 Tax=Cryptolaemus montrouzieri TaxID=559131 RepID=A0ABD2NGW9_9CUCU
MWVQCSAAARLYKERYPHAKRHPDYRVFEHVHQSYSEGRLLHVRKSGDSPDADYGDMVLDEVENDVGTSVRAIKMNTGVPRSITQRILKRHQYHPYHAQRVQTLLSQDYLPRMEFYRRMLAKSQDFWTKYSGRMKQHARPMATLTSIIYMNGILKTHI